MELTPRLQRIAELVPHGAVAADIGTDHGYLPIYLVLQGISPRALACDVRPGPLDKARANVREYGLEGKISCRLSDGFEEVTERDADTAVMAGMGGRLCAELLLREMRREKNILPALKALLLQPQSDVAAVRRTVHRAGFFIAQETMTVDRGKRYTVLLCRPGHETYADELDYQYGKLLREKRDPILYAELLERRGVIDQIRSRLGEGESAGSAACAKRRRELDLEEQGIEEVLRRWE